jgi:pimeloyl-ACP methyl ester carboxylesterase
MHYYERAGQGLPVVFIHGAFADSRVWDPQWKRFSSKYATVRYDLRGHGKTGVSELKRYSMATYADDLASLLDALGIDSAVVCGLSWGGAIAQGFAVRSPERLTGLVLAGSTVSMSLTLREKLLRYVVFPRWAMLLTIRAMSVERFVRFSFWLAGVTLGRQWLNRDEGTLAYLKECMLQIDRREYLKIWGAIYGFDLLPLERISCPTLVVNGERDSGMALRHAAEILRRIPQAEARVIPGEYHAMTMEAPEAFNALLEEFLGRLAWQVT